LRKKEVAFLEVVAFPFLETVDSMAVVNRKEYHKVQAVVHNIVVAVEVVVVVVESLHRDYNQRDSTTFS